MENKTVITTGAASGIGKATAELFAKQGANVVISDIDEQTEEPQPKALSPQVVRPHFSRQMCPSPRIWRQWFLSP